MKYRKLTEQEFIVMDEAELHRQKIANIAKQIREGFIDQIDPMTLLKYSNEIKEYQEEYHDFLSFTKKIKTKGINNE